MPRSSYAAPRPELRFAPPWLLLGLLAGSLAAFAWLFPAGELERLLARSPGADEAAVAYLGLMLRAHPGDEKLRLRLARRALDAGEWAKAGAALSPWRDVAPGDLPPAVLGMKARLLAARIGGRDSGSDGAYAELTRLAGHLSPAACNDLAARLIGLGHYRAAVQVSGLALAAAATTQEAERAFNLGIDAMLAAGRPVDALTLAESRLSAMSPDTRIWRRMTWLALGANRPVLAARYARRVVGMGPVPE